MLESASIWRRFDAQRLLDVALAVPALTFTAPLLLLAALAVRLTSPGPAFFRQVRIGRDERPFTLFKLRTMHIDADHRAQEALNCQELMGDAAPEAGLFKSADDPRITPVGRFLRVTSIDELRQLFNVLRGDMSLVGPRPALPYEVALFTPGLTGLWQVSGRNRLSTREMLQLDLVYLEARSIRLDLWLLLQTPKAVLFERATR